MYPMPFKPSILKMELLNSSQEMFALPMLSHALLCTPMPTDILYWFY